MQKRIGIVGWKVGEGSFGATIPYLEYISKFGVPIILHPNSPILDLDLLILPGGPDIDTSRYEGNISLYVQKSCPIREHFDRIKLPEYIKRKTPIFAVCRGMQSIAVIFGASLYADMNHEYSIKNRFDTAHKILILKECRNILGIKEDIIEVNSLHHQAIIRDTLPDNLKVIAIYTGKLDKTIEAIAHTELPIAGVQYHPEELYIDILSDAIIERLLDTKKPILTNKESKIFKA